MNPITIKQANREDDIRAVFSIRREVFVEEQRMFRDSDIDENDCKSTYLIAKCNGTSVGTVRIFPVGDDAWVGGRLAVRETFRGTYAGCLLVKEAVNLVTTKNCKKFSAVIQKKNVAFFKQLGWKPIGEVISHLGCPHQVMEADLENGKGRE